jgi:hypothetical protein
MFATAGRTAFWVTQLTPLMTPEVLPLAEPVLRGRGAHGQRGATGTIR